MSGNKVVGVFEDREKAYGKFNKLKEKGKKVKLERTYTIDEKLGKIKEIFIIEELK
jgi:hypothetical protein